jgi:hypothetical protein
MFSRSQKMWARGVRRTQKMWGCNVFTYPEKAGGVVFSRPLNSLTNSERLYRSPVYVRGHA